MKRAAALITALVCLCFMLPVLAQEVEETPEPFTRADNECFSGGTMEGKCHQGFRADGTVTEGDIAWAWTCGWYMARFNDGTFTREEVNTQCNSLLPKIELDLPLVEDCGIFFNGDYTLCIKGNYIRQDANNDGSFEEAWIITSGTLAGDDGNCPAGTSFSGSEVANYQFSEPAFYAWITGKGFGHYDDFCTI